MLFRLVAFVLLLLSFFYPSLAVADRPTFCAPSLAEIPDPEARPYTTFSNFWKLRHKDILRAMNEQDYTYVFLGDSLTHGWPKEEWERLFPKSDALNMGIGGDTTDGLIWRLQNGHAIKDYDPLFIVLIGTNDIGLERTPEQTAKDIGKLLALLKRDHPASPILLLGLWPRDETPSAPLRQKTQKVNALIRSCADGKNIAFLDLGPFLLDKDGSLPEDMAPDFLHPSKKGYSRLVEPLRKEIKKLEKNAHAKK